MLHRLPIRLGAHDDSNDGVSHVRSSLSVRLRSLLRFRSGIAALELRDVIAELDVVVQIIVEIILVGNADVGEHGALLAILDLLLVLELQQKVADPTKTPAMVGSDAVRG